MPINYELQNAALADDANASAITACLADRAGAASQEGRPVADLVTFFEPARDWAQLEAARAWWPRDVPPNMSWASSLLTALGGYCPAHPSMAEPSLLAALGSLARGVQAHLVAAGADPDNPNETRADRARRLNRERVAAYRARHREVAEDGEARRPVIEAWDRVQELRRGRQAARVELDAEVRAAHQVMMAAAERRTRVIGEWDARVAAAEEDHRLLRAS